uniref:HOOK domain-containing protein n=1 Tax=Gongylonema pulchrum TaxID=637853 RepID=A0A183D5S7_9BILA
LDEQVASLIARCEELKGLVQIQQDQIRKLDEEKQVLCGQLQDARDDENRMVEQNTENEHSLHMVATLKADLLEKEKVVEDENSSLLAKIQLLENNEQENEKEMKCLLQKMDDIHVGKEDLTTEMNDMRIAYDRSCSEVKQLKEQLIEKEEEISNLRCATATADNEINNRATQMDELIAKNATLEAINEKLRIEFLQKVRIIIIILCDEFRSLHFVELSSRISK